MWDRGRTVHVSEYSLKVSITRKVILNICRNVQNYENKYKGVFLTSNIPIIETRNVCCMPNKRCGCADDNDKTPNIINFSIITLLK